MTHKDLFNSVNKVDLLKDIDNFHKKYQFEKNEKVGIPNDNELVNFRTSFLMEELAEYTNAITKKTQQEL
jgi:predicted HAD superfamily Cof-like phosphohydrolase